MSSSPNTRNVDVKGFPAPSEGFVLTHLLIVADQDRSREFYRKVLGAEVIRARDPVVLRISNSWLIINAGGGPTDDKPDVIAAPGSSPNPRTLGVRFTVTCAIQMGTSLKWDKPPAFSHRHSARLQPCRGWA